MPESAHVLVVDDAERARLVADLVAGFDMFQAAELEGKVRYALASRSRNIALRRMRDDERLRRELEASLERRKG